MTKTGLEFTRNYFIFGQALNKVFRNDNSIEIPFLMCKELNKKTQTAVLNKLNI